VALYHRSGKSITSLAAELGVAHESLRQWIKREQLDRGERHDGLTSDERAELVELRRKVRRLEQEREILKQATAFFASETR
jgi:transposase-like protein